MIIYILRIVCDANPRGHCDLSHIYFSGLFKIRLSLQCSHMVKTFIIYGKITWKVHEYANFPVIILSNHCICRRFSHQSFIVIHFHSCRAGGCVILVDSGCVDFSSSAEGKEI